MTIGERERAREVAEAIQNEAYGRILYALQKERSLAQMEIDVLEARCERLARELDVYKKAVEGS